SDQIPLPDIARNKKMEARLHHEQEFARRLVSSMSEVITALDCEGRYTFVTPRIREMLGHAPEELLGTTFGSYVRPDDLPCVQKAFEDMISRRVAETAI